MVDGVLNWQLPLNVSRKFLEFEKAAERAANQRIKPAEVNSSNVLAFLLGEAAVEVRKESNNSFAQLRIQLANLARDIVDVALSSKTYSGFTGNTQTSYSVGIYQDGNLLQIVSTGEAMASPVSPKIQQGELRIYNPDGSGNQKSVYEDGGRVRRVYGIAPVNGLSGEDTAREILQHWDFGGNPPKFALVFTTGTEYSKYIEVRRQTGTAEAFSYAIHHSSQLR